MKNIIYTLILAFVIFIGAGILLNYYSAPDNTLVIAFFGILATFVVIGNYSQVYNLTQSTNEKIRAFENKINNLNDQTVSELKPKSLKNEILYIKQTIFDKRGISQLSNLQTRLSNLERKNLQTQQRALLYLPLNDILYLEIGEQKTLIRDILLHSNKRLERNIKTQEARRSVKAYVRWSQEEGIIVENKAGQRIENVTHVASKPFDKNKLETIIYNLLNISKCSVI